MNTTMTENTIDKHELAVELFNEAFMEISNLPESFIEETPLIPVLYEKVEKYIEKFGMDNREKLLETAKVIVALNFDDIMCGRW